MYINLFSVQCDAHLQLFFFNVNCNACARDPYSRDRDQDRDVEPRDRDETETLTTLFETRPRRDLGYVSRPSRDRDFETETTSLKTNTYRVYYLHTNVLV
jgi:hypothetical protein